MSYFSSVHIGFFVNLRGVVGFGARRKTYRTVASHQHRNTWQASIHNHINNIKKINHKKCVVNKFI